MTTLLYPFFEFMAPIRAARQEKGDDPESNVTKTILHRSLKISKNYHKDVYEGCMNLMTYFEIMEEYSGFAGDTELSDEQKLKIGWFLRYSHNVFAYIQLMNAAIDYCKQYVGGGEWVKADQAKLDAIIGKQKTMN